MKRLAKYLGITAAVLLILLCAGAWFLNRWLQSPSARSRIEDRLADELRMPVKFAKLNFSLISGLVVEGVSIPGAEGNALTAASISVNPRFLPLLFGKISLGDVRIDQPRVRLIEDASGKWRLPLPTPVQPAAPSLPPPNEVTAAPPQKSAAPVTAPAKPRKKPSISIKRIVLTGGDADLIDKASAPFATIRGVNVTLTDATAETFTGSFEIGHATIHGVTAIDGLRGHATRDKGQFHIPDYTAGIGGGSITGSGTWAERGSGSAKARLDSIDLHRAARAGGVASPKVSGVVSGDVQVAGLGSDKKALTGNGTIILKGGRSREIDVLRQIGDILSIAFLANFEIADATATFTLANGEVALSPMNIATPPFGIRLTGPVAFDGTMNLTAFLHGPADLIEKNAVVAREFAPRDANNRRSLEFNITGPLNKPKQNLAERITGTKDRREQRIIAAEAIISAIFDRKKPKPAQAPPPPQPAPAQP